MRHSVFITAVAFLVACGSSLPNAWEIQDLRVIAITLDKPEVAPGETVRVVVYTDDPDGAGRPVTIEHGFCKNRDASAGEFDCVGGPDYVVLGSGTSVPTGVADISLYEFDYTVPADLLNDKSQIALQYGYNEHIVLRANNGARIQNATKRVVVKAPSASPANVNPAFFDFEIVRDGVVIDAAREGLVRGFDYLLRPIFDAGSLQTYTVKDFEQQDVTLDEEASFVWSCATACALDRRTSFGTDTVLLGTPQESSLRSVINVHVVMRDGRGGEVAIFKRFVLLPTVSASAE